MRDEQAEERHERADELRDRVDVRRRLTVIDVFVERGAFHRGVDDGRNRRARYEIVERCIGHAAAQRLAFGEGGLLKANCPFDVAVREMEPVQLGVECRLLGMRVVSLGFHWKAASRRSGELEGRRLGNARRTEIGVKRSRQPGRSSRWPDVLSEAAMERAGRDLPDAAVGADVAGHEVSAVRTDVERVTQIAGRARSDATRFPVRDVPELGVALPDEQLLAVGGNATSKLPKVG